MCKSSDGKRSTADAERDCICADTMKQSSSGDDGAMIGVGARHT